MPEAKDDDTDIGDDSLSVASSAPTAADLPPKRSGSEGITVFLRMSMPAPSGGGAVRDVPDRRARRRPTKRPSKFYDVSEKEGKKGQALKWDIPADAVAKDGECAPARADPPGEGTRDGR